MKRKPIPHGDKKVIALGFGCLPGAAVAIPCDWCEAMGEIFWRFGAPGGSGVHLSAGFEWDHYTPLSRGGENGLGNIYPICRTCNRKKGAMTAHEYALKKHPELRE